MAYVTPNSTLQLFKGINLDNRYLHTIYFASESAQNTWFSSKVYRTFNELMYRRYESNAVKLEADATSLLGVTYLRFKNSRASSKWFYAFVTGIDYINENTTAVYYEIDVMQTWFIQNGSINPCMVLREHVNNDTFGIELEHEPVGSDVYDCDLLAQYGDNYFSNYSVYLNTTGEPTDGDMYQNGLFNGTQYTRLPCNNSSNADSIKLYLSSLLGSWDAGAQQQDVIDMYTAPSFLGQSYAIQPIPKQFNRPTAYDNYIPKNNKLFMYPYSYLVCTTHNGSGEAYKWEYFDGTEIDFRMMGSYIGGGQIICYPRAYNGQLDNLDCKVIMSDFPKNPFVYDAYQAWVASGGKTRYENDWDITVARGASAVLKDYANVVGSATFNPNMDEKSIGIGIGTGLVKNVASAVGTMASIQEAQNKVIYQFKDANYVPNIPVGASMPNVMVGARMLDFYFYHCHVRDDEAKRIDDFFSCYGYSINKVKAPNLTGRQYWNFVQTQNAVISGDIPASSKDAIGRIFDGGITFWHNGDQVGNYSQSVSQGSINNPIV